MLWDTERNRIKGGGDNDKQILNIFKHTYMYPPRKVLMVLQYNSDSISVLTSFKEFNTNYTWTKTYLLPWHHLNNYNELPT